MIEIVACHFWFGGSNSRKLTDTDSIIWRKLPRQRLVYISIHTHAGNVNLRPQQTTHRVSAPIPRALPPDYSDLKGDIAVPRWQRWHLNQ